MAEVYRYVIHKDTDSQPVPCAYDCRWKGLYFQDMQDRRKRQFLDQYKETYAGFSYTLTQTSDKAGTADQILTISYKGQTLANYDELHNWELSNHVTSLNYYDKEGSKFEGIQRVPNVILTTTFMPKDDDQIPHWTNSAIRMAERDQIEVHTPRSWKHRLITAIKSILGIDQPIKSTMDYGYFDSAQLDYDGTSMPVRGCKVLPDSITYSHDGYDTVVSFLPSSSPYSGKLKYNSCWFYRTVMASDLPDGYCDRSLGIVALRSVLDYREWCEFDYDVQRRILYG